jgi:fibronectin type 3 domain-containing protein
MTLQQTSRGRALIKRLSLGFTALVVAGTGLASLNISSASAACQAPATSYGAGSASVAITQSATYRVWSRVMAPDTTNNTYLLEIDGGSCYTVGGGSIVPNTWKWVDYKDQTTTSKIDVALAPGTHTFKFIGNQPNVKLDKVIFASDLNCIPVDDGSNCDTPSDTTPPTVSLTAPAEGGTVSGQTAITATASDNTSITKVDFYANSVLVGSDNTTPYSVNWDTTKVANGNYTLIARAYDSANNVTTDSYVVTVQNGDTQAPTVPTGVTATVNSSNKVTVTWKASTDNVAVKSYQLVRNGTPLADVGNVLTYADTTVTASKQYSYQVIAVDAAGNKSAASTTSVVTTPSAPDTQAPSAPSALGATAVSRSQVNLGWTASTDNSGVVTYDIYRKPQSGEPVKVGSSSTVSFGVTNLTNNTSYDFYVVARDATGNTSPPSNTVTVKTLTGNKKATIWGTVSNSRTGNHLHGARVIVESKGKNRVYRADSDGRYRINDLEAGSYTLTFRAPGYQSKSVRVSLGDGAVKMQNISLGRR